MTDPHALVRDIWNIWDIPRYEPVPRKHGGSRVPVYVSHRFPIKGGISLREVMTRQMIQPTPLLRMLQKPKKGI